MTQELIKVFLSAELRGKLLTSFQQMPCGPQKLALAPFTSEKAEFVPYSLLQKLYPEEAEALVSTHKCEVVKKQLPILSLVQEREISAKMYRHYVGPQFRDKISVNSLSEIKSERLFPLGFSVIDIFATAITLAVVGGFLAKARKFPIQKIALWATTGFVFGLALDITIYFLKFKKGDMQGQQLKRARIAETKKAD